MMKFEYETNSGTKGRVEADTEQLAVVMLSEQYGEGHATLIEGKAPAATTPTAAPAAPATQAPAPAAATPTKDEHGWARAFKLAASRSG